MCIIEQNVHHCIMETFFVLWNNKLYDMFLSDMVETYREKHPELANPMDCPFNILSFFHDFFTDNLTCLGNMDELGKHLFSIIKNW